ncbi:hypothetical protein ACIB24_07885 [Spongisporangium articulatum]|uniref:Uncharacterized protein n=1 Tax=Spongisporangium articulatum TaxID=3362603 RepID=A0ABW8AKU6_9ACTN
MAMQIRRLARIAQGVSVLVLIWVLVLLVQGQATNGWVALVVCTTLVSVGLQLLVLQEEARNRPPE